MKHVAFGLFLALFLSNCQQNQPSAAAEKTPTPAAESPAIVMADAPNFAAAGIEDVAAFRVFFQKLQNELVEPSAKEKLADLVAFPIRAAETRADFLKNYDSIITEKVRSAVKNQKFNALFCRDQGVMFGSGELWVAPAEGGGIKVVGVNP